MANVSKRITLALAAVLAATALAAPATAQEAAGRGERHAFDGPC